MGRVCVARDQKRRANARNTPGRQHACMFVGLSIAFEPPASAYCALRVDNSSQIPEKFRQQHRSIDRNSTP